MPCPSRTHRPRCHTGATRVPFFHSGRLPGKLTPPLERLQQRKGLEPVRHGDALQDAATRASSLRSRHARNHWIPPRVRTPATTPMNPKGGRSDRSPPISHAPRPLQQIDCSRTARRSIGIADHPRPASLTGGRSRKLRDQGATSASGVAVLADCGSHVVDSLVLSHAAERLLRA
jgi:hypothetical protein